MFVCVKQCSALSYNKYVHKQTESTGLMECGIANEYYEQDVKGEMYALASREECKYKYEWASPPSLCKDSCEDLFEFVDTQNKKTCAANCSKEATKNGDMVAEVDANGVKKCVPLREEQCNYVQLDENDNYICVSVCNDFVVLDGTVVDGIGGEPLTINNYLGKPHCVPKCQIPMYGSNFTDKPYQPYNSSKKWSSTAAWN